MTGPTQRDAHRSRSDRSPSRATLAEIARAHGTDKEGVHHYAAAYSRHLEHLRDMPIRLLEIGIGGYADPTSGGESLRMWKEYFPHAQIVGLDIYDKTALAADRIAIVQGDQSDPDVLDGLAARYGPFDVIVDDGSHLSTHVIASFRGLYRHLADGGIYAIEDLQTSYWERYGGSSEVDRQGTSMTFLLGLVNGLNYAEFDLIGYQPTEFDEGITSIEFYHNLAFVTKGLNRDGSSFLPPHPRERFHLRASRPRPQPRRDLRSRVLKRMRSLVGRMRRR